MPAVLPEIEGVEGVPDEAAVIAYASLERFQYAHDWQSDGDVFVWAGVGTDPGFSSQFQDALAALVRDERSFLA